MHSSTSNSSWRTMLRPLLIFIFMITLYHTLTLGRVLPSSEGINIPETNHVKVEKYVYNNSKFKWVLVGSSRTAQIVPEDIGSEVANLGMRGIASGTGLEIVQRTKLKPSILLVEINETIGRPKDTDLIDSVFNPFYYYARLYFPMFRTEYKPVSVFIQAIRNFAEKQNIMTIEQLQKQRLIDTKSAKENNIKTTIAQEKQPLSEKSKRDLILQAEVLKSQIAEIEKSGIRVVLYDVPGDRRVDNTMQRRQQRDILRNFFTADTFEWLPEPPVKDWITTDGVHLIHTEAKELATFIREQLLSTPREKRLPISSGR